MVRYEPYKLIFVVLAHYIQPKLITRSSKSSQVKMGFHGFKCFTLSFCGFGDFLHKVMYIFLDSNLMLYNTLVLHSLSIR